MKRKKGGDRGVGGLLWWSYLPYNISGIKTTNYLKFDRQILEFISRKIQHLDHNVKTGRGEGEDETY